MNLRMRKVLSLVLLVVFLSSTALLIRYHADTARGESAYDKAAELAAVPREDLPVQTEPTEPLPTEAPTETVPVTEPKVIKTQWVPADVEEDAYIEDLKQINLETLREVSPNVVAWIFIPNTPINYPVVQGEDNEFFLHHTWEGKKSALGSIFLEYTNSPDFKDFRTIVYGHNMKNGSMFNKLHRYTDKTYWEKYPHVYLVTDDGILRYEIYSCYRAAVESNTYALYLEESQEKQDFIQMTLEESQLKTDIIPVETDRILTLSTCIGHGDYRRVVHARLPMVEVEVTE